MSKKKPLTINQLLNKPDGDIQALMDRLAKIKLLNSILNQQIQPPMSEHCRVVNLRKNCLIIAVDSPIWLNKLRFQQTELMSQFRSKGFISLANIEIIVQPK